MGNSSSSEQPRRAGQKLSKPRVGYPVSSPNPSSTNNTSQTAAAHYSNSYVVGSPPIPAPEPAITSPSVQDLAFSDTRGPGDTASGQIKDVQQSNGESSPQVVQPEPQDMLRRSSSGLAERSTSSYQRTSIVQPLTRATSWTTRENRRSAVYDERSVDLQKTANKKALVLKDTLESHVSMHDLNGPHPSIGFHSQSTGHLPLNRTQSVASLYAPPRRRSSNQTPGVATRIEGNVPVLTRKSSFRHSLPPTPSTVESNPFDALAKRRMSMPLHAMASQDLDRIPTPTEAEYKQLGVMKFGSLRIMNGTPTSSHSPERDPFLAQKNPVNTNPLVTISHDDHNDRRGGWKTSEDDSIVIAHPKPVSGTLSPAVTNLSETVKDMAHQAAEFPSPSGSSTSHDVVGDSDTTPMSSISSATEGGSLTPPTGPSIDSARKESIELEPRKSLGGDDGGNVESSQKSVRSLAGSESTFSSKSSKKQQNSSSSSGHRSRLSFRSLRGLRSRKSEDNKAESKSSPERRPSLKQTGPFQSPNRERQSGLPPGVPPVPSLPKSNPEHSDGQHSRPLPDQTPSHATSSISGRSTSHNPGQSTESGPSKSATAENRTKPSDISAAVNGINDGDLSSQKIGKLQRLVGNPRRKSLPAMPSARPYHEPDVPVPALPTEEVIQRTDSRMSLKRRSLRLDPTKQSAASTAFNGGKDASRVTSEAFPQDHTPADVPDSTSHRSTLSQRPASFVSTKRSSRRNSLLRMTSISSKKSSADMGVECDDDMGIDDILPYDSSFDSIDSIRRSVGNSAFDAAFVPLTEDYGMRRIQARNQSGHPSHKGPGGPLSYPPLRSRSSAPDFLETVMEPASPGGTDSASQKKPKTPPPISIRTRGSKKSRRKRSSTHHPEVPPLPSQYAGMPPGPGGRSNRSNYPFSEDISQSLRSIPIQSYGTPQMTQGGPQGPYQMQQAGQRFAPKRPMFADSMASYHHGRSKSHHISRPDHCTTPPMDSHGQSTGHGSTLAEKGDTSNPPFRVLHSYNSPAYRGAPIWAT